MSLVRWTNLICGWLIILFAVGFLVFLPWAVADYDREPEDVWIGLSWIALSGFIATLCFVNARDSRTGGAVGARWWLIVSNAGVLAGAIILLMAGNNPVLLPLLIPFVLGPAVALAWELQRPKI